MGLRHKVSMAQLGTARGTELPKLTHRVLVLMFGDPKEKLTLPAWPPSASLAPPSHACSCLLPDSVRQSPDASPPPAPVTPVPQSTLPHAQHLILSCPNPSLPLALRGLRDEP